jgi:uncharacterized protein YdeI (YjbR/CyaY-like superfamily)
MPVLAAGNTVYTRPVAKVMISIPDDLLERLDAQARANQETRSGYLQRLAEREITAAQVGRRQELRELLEKATGDMGGRGVQMIREDRESH